MAQGRRAVAGEVRASWVGRARPAPARHVLVRRRGTVHVWPRRTVDARPRCLSESLAISRCCAAPRRRTPDNACYQTLQVTGEAGIPYPHPRRRAPPPFSPTEAHMRTDHPPHHLPQPPNHPPIQPLAPIPRDSQSFLVPSGHRSSRAPSILPQSPHLAAPFRKPTPTPPRLSNPITHYTTQPTTSTRSGSL